MSEADETTPATTSPPIPTDFHLISTSLNAKGSAADKQVDAITSVFKFSDEQLGKTEEYNRNFQQATGKFTAAMPAGDFDFNNGIYYKVYI